MAQSSDGLAMDYQSNPPSPGDESLSNIPNPEESPIRNLPITPNSLVKTRGRVWDADDKTKFKKMKVEAESGSKTEETLDQLLAAVRIDESLTKKDIEILANKLLDIGKLRDDQCENDMKLTLDIQHSNNSESDKLRKRIEALKEIQLQHRALEILFLKERAELIKEYEDVRMLLLEKGWNEVLVYKSKIVQGLAEEKGQFLHPVSVKADKYRELKGRFLMQRDELEEKFLKSYCSSYKKRCDIVNGIFEVEANSEAATNQKGNYNNSQDNRGVPDFWLNAMKNNPILAQQITKHDEEALKYLTDIKWKKESGFGFELNFIFRCNPYFKNSVLTKMYQKPIHLGTSASKIKWHEGKCLTHDFIKESGRKPMIRTCNSFFHFFDPLPPHPTEEEIYNHGRYIVETFKGNIKYDYHIGKIIRDKIIPHAISWYTGEALQVGSEFRDEEYDDGYSENEEDEDEDKDDNDEEDDEEDEDEDIDAGQSH